MILRDIITTPVMAVCEVLFFASMLTLILCLQWRPSSSKRRKWAIATVIASGAVLLNGAGLLPVHQASSSLPVHQAGPSLSIIMPERAGQQPAIEGCGRITVLVAGSAPSSQTVVLTTNQDGAQETQVESGVAWDPGRKVWVGQVTLAAKWPADNHSEYTLGVYLVPESWVGYMRVAADAGTKNTWWWQTKPPQEVISSTSIPVTLVKHPGTGQDGSPCPDR